MNRLNLRILLWLTRLKKESPHRYLLYSSFALIPISFCVSVLLLGPMHNSTKHEGHQSHKYIGRVQSALPKRTREKRYIVQFTPSSGVATVDCDNSASNKASNSSHLIVPLFGKDFLSTNRRIYITSTYLSLILQNTTIPVPQPLDRCQFIS